MATVRHSGRTVQSTGAPYAPIRYGRFHSVKSSMGHFKGYNVKSAMDTSPPTLYCRINDNGVFTNEDVNAGDAGAGDVTLLPAVEEVNDAFYIGSNVTFDFFIIRISTPAVGGTGVWEYYNGSAWVTMTGLTDNTIGLTAAAGFYKCPFTEILSQATIDGQAGYWIRFRVTAANFTTIPICSQIWAGGQDEYEIYTDLILDGTETHLVIGTVVGPLKPIWDLYINGVFDSSGYDDYAASSDDKTTDVTVTQPLRKQHNEIMIKINGKNASSTAYDLNIYGIGAY